MQRSLPRPAARGVLGSRVAPGALCLLACLACLSLPAAAQAPRVQLGGVMGARALLIIDGQRQLLAVGDSAQGVRLRTLQADSAEVEVQGRALTLRLGAAALVPESGATRPRPANEIVLTAGPGGHFVTDGAINGRPARFLVDTGATTVSLGQADAERLGLDLRHGQQGLSSTANGTVPVVLLTLARVRVGEVEVSQVPAVVMPQPMPYILLGNSFLTRFQMRRENDVMRLELRR